jgi:hypothetical protein
MNDATIIVSGGTSPYMYAWSNGATASTAANLVAGTYTVTVTDDNACVFTASTTVTQPAAFTLAASSTNPTSCVLDNGTATATTTGGVAPFSFVWSNNATTSTINNLAAGSFSVTATDDNGCVGSVTGIVVNNPNAPTARITAFTAVSCNGGNNGQATAAATGGTAPYNFSWNNGANTATATGLVAGVYTANITDAASCSGVASVTITQPTALAASVNTAATANVSCFGGNNGTASVAVSGGTGAYAYTWSNGGNAATISGLTAGVYTATVTDANLCASTLAITVTQPATALAVTANSNDISCNGAANGTATASATGGTAPYSYSWSNAANGASLNGLAAGTYTVKVFSYDSTDNDRYNDTIYSTFIVTARVNSFSISNLSTDSFTINWTGIAGATSYYLDVATDAGFTSMLGGYSNLQVIGTSQNVNGLTFGVKYYYRLRTTNSCGTSINSITDSITTLTNGATLNVTAFLQGLYLGGGLMTSSPFNYDGVSSPTVADTITVELYNPDYTLAYSVRDTLSTTGQASITFPGSAVGNKYYVVIKHRSSLETWSSDSILIGSTTSYDFSSGAGQAYFDGGPNMPLVDDGSGVYLIYSGDITQDGAVDFNDYPDLDSENLLGTYPAYLATDLNADGITDFNDYPLLDANNLLGSLIQRPY